MTPSMTSTVLAVDPGMTTGLAWCDTAALMPGKFDERIGHLVRHRQIGGDLGKQARLIVKGCASLGVRVLVVESFQLRAGVPLRGKGALAPVKLGAMLEVLLGEDRLIEWQTASQGKSVMTDVRMKAIGCWWPGEPHAVDAGRHLLTFVRRVRSGKVKVDGGA